MNHLHPRRTPPGARVLAVVAMLTAIVPMALLAQQAPSVAVSTLSIEEAIRLARDHNPLLQQQRSDLTVARSSVRAAYGSLVPTANASTGFNYTAAGERRFGSVEFANQPDYYGSSYNLSLNYQLSGSTLLQPSVERARERATERRVVGAEASLVSQVSQQYLAVLQAREQEEQALREVERTAEHVRLAQARLEVGAGTPLDVRRAEVQHGRAEVGVVQARSNSATQVLVLGQLVGVPLDPAVQLTSEFAIFDPTWAAEELLRMATENNPTLLAARSSVSAAQTGVQAARSSYLPSLNFNVGMAGSVYQAGNVDPLVRDQLSRLENNFQQCLAQNELRVRVNLPPLACQNPVGNPLIESQVREQITAQNTGFPFDYSKQPLQASMSISLPIFTGFTRQLQIDQAKASATDARHEVRAQELRVMQEVGTAVLNLETAYETALLQEQVRQNAAEELRLAQERFRFGAASSVEVTDAQTNLSQAERDQINAVYSFHQSLAALEALVGRRLR